MSNATTGSEGEAPDLAGVPILSATGGVAPLVFGRPAPSFRRASS